MWCLQGAAAAASDHILQTDGQPSAVYTTQYRWAAAGRCAGSVTPCCRGPPEPCRRPALRPGGLSSLTCRRPAGCPIVHEWQPACPLLCPAHGPVLLDLETRPVLWFRRALFNQHRAHVWLDKNCWFSEMDVTLQQPLPTSGDASSNSSSRNSSTMPASSAHC